MAINFKQIEGGVSAPKGFRASGIHCGIKKDPDKKDLALVVSLVPADAAGIFTRNVVKAAPVVLCSELLSSKNKIEAIIVNSGNANCMTAKKGLDNAKLMSECTAKLLGIDPRAVLVASTGIIGRQLPIDKIKAGLPELINSLSENGGNLAASAILTTDTKTKERSVEFSIFGTKVRIGIMAKGAGMISPNMATLIVCITTDLCISPDMLKRALVLASENSFNAMSIDADMSTNDSVFIMANGLAANKKIVSQKTKEFDTFVEVLSRLANDVAMEILKDGEGVTKLMKITVKKVCSRENAAKVARSIGNSSLVKTALHGADPNWGRIASSAGASGVKFALNKLDIFIGKKAVVKNGTPLNVSVDLIREQFEKDFVEITVVLNEGESEFTFFSTDLSEEYIRVNASYST